MVRESSLPSAVTPAPSVAHLGRSAARENPGTEEADRDGERVLLSQSRGKPTRGDSVSIWHTSGPRQLKSDRSGTPGRSGGLLALALCRHRDLCPSPRPALCCKPSPAATLAGKGLTAGGPRRPIRADRDGRRTGRRAFRGWRPADGPDASPLRTPTGQPCGRSNRPGPRRRIPIDRDTAEIIIPDSRTATLSALPSTATGPHWPRGFP